MPARQGDWATTRNWIADHFDGKAATWEALTSDRPVGRIRTSVRQGRTEMADTLLSWLPESLAGSSVLDAGCGLGGLAIAMGARGGDVLGVDVSASLVELGRLRLEEEHPSNGKVRLEVGDMLAPTSTTYDHVVAMDSLLHYTEEQLIEAVAALSRRTRRSLLFTFAPRTPFLGVMHGLGTLFPKSDRSPHIVPVPVGRLMNALPAALGDGWTLGRTHRVSRGFYTSQALELRRAA
jgi:magnesium-protoporphyrin O-methyltransferase